MFLIAPPGIASAEVIPGPAVVQLVRPAGWESHVCGAPSLYPGPITILVGPAGTGEAPGSPGVVLVLRPQPAWDGERTGQVVVVRPGRLAPPGVPPPSGQLPAPSLRGSYRIAAAGAVAPTSAVSSPGLRPLVAPQGIAAGAVGTPVVAGEGTLLPVGWDEGRVGTPRLRAPEDRYRQYAMALAPPWLLRERGANWVDVHGASLDALVERVVDAIQAHLIDTAPDDALGLLGRERGIQRMPQEPDWTYREQVRAAWDLWQWGGTRRGIVQLFQRLGYQYVEIGELWRTDRSRWAEFVIYLFGPTQLSLSRDQVVRLVNDWKAAHSKLAGIVQIVGGFRWDDGTLWDSYPSDPDAWWDGDVVIV